jgi:hypothetical protein
VKRFVLVGAREDVAVGEKDVRGLLAVVRPGEDSVGLKLVRTEEDGVDGEGADGDAVSVRAQSVEQDRR